MHRSTRSLLNSFGYGFALVAVLTALGLAVMPFHYPLMPGITLAGLIFSSGVESDHRLRFEVAALFFNTLVYGLAIFFILLRPQHLRRRHVRRYYS